MLILHTKELNLLLKMLFKKLKFTQINGNGAKMFLVLKLNQNVPLKSKRSCLIRYNREEMHPTKISNILLHKQAIIMDFQLN